MTNDIPVPPEPVVAIHIDGGAVTVDGTAVHHDGAHPPQQVAIDAVASQVAQRLRRPVRAIATDRSGRTSMVVHPDGHVTDVQSLTPVVTGDNQPGPTPPTPPVQQVPQAPQMDEFHRFLTAPETASGQVRAAPPWSPPPPQGPGPSPTPDEQHGVEQAPISSLPDTRAARRAAAQNRSFLSHHEVVEPAHTGLRGFLTRIGIRSEPSEAERSERADVRAISRHWPGPRTIAVVNGKGGAGKTPTTVILAALFARQGGSGVLAWDNNETRGTLGWRTEKGPHERHVLDLLPHADSLMQPTARAADLAAFVHHQTDDKFDVLRSNPLLLPHQQRLTADDFDAVHLVASKYFRLIFIDSGNDETAPHWLRMIDHADQLVVATTTRPDHAEAGRLLLDALRDRDEHSSALAEAAVVVVSQADREEASAETIAAGFDGLAREAVTIPYDRAMRTPWLRSRALQPATQRAYLRAASAVSEGL